MKNEFLHFFTSCRADWISSCFRCNTIYCHFEDKNDCVSLCSKLMKTRTNDDPLNPRYDFEDEPECKTASVYKLPSWLGTILFRLNSWIFFSDAVKIVGMIMSSYLFFPLFHSFLILQSIGLWEGTWSFLTWFPTYSRRNSEDQSNNENKNNN